MSSHPSNQRVGTSRHLATMILSLLIASLHGAVTTPLRATTSTDCPTADPYDQASDTEALQECVDNYDIVMLEPQGGGGYYGYYIGANEGNGLRLRNAGRGYGPILMSGGDNKAVLIATDDLEYPVIDVDGDTDGWELHGLIIDGNRYGRSDLLSECQGYNGVRSNVLAKGHNFYVVGVESVRALCGSAFEVHGDNFEISNSSFVDNGTEVSEAPGGTTAWSDGLTLLYCEDGYVHDNTFYDNTDVDLVVNTVESACYVAHNYVEHTYKAGVAGLNVWSDYSQAELQVWDNTIYSDEDLLAGGLVLGLHPWDSGVTSPDVGEIYENDIHGAVINLVIDGIGAGYVYDNTFGTPQGNSGLGGCTTSTNYTAAHVGSATIQGSYTTLAVHPTGCS